MNQTVGGSATARGIWFQALYVLLQAAEARVHRTGDEGDTSPANLQIVLEPHGGDARFEMPTSRRVVQLKSRVRGEPWSLKELVEEVLPDLYRAVDLADEQITYEFVTEGRLGEWSSVKDFFGTLRKRAADAGGIDQAHKALDQTEPLVFGGSGGDFWKGGTTERGVFDRIVNELRGPAPAAGRPDRRDPWDLAVRKAWQLLARFKFDGGWSPELVRAAVERSLLPVVEAREKVPQLSWAMTGWLIDRSGENETCITPEELLAEHGLGQAVSVANRLALERRCSDSLRVRLDRLGYRPGWDMRRSEASTIQAPLTAITGESGMGKSWGIYAAADAARTPAVVLIESSGDANRDLEKAASKLWQEALGRDEPKPLSNIAQHLAEVLDPARGDPWLTLFIDQLNDVDATNGLLAEPLDRWGIRLVLGCEPHVAERLKQHGRQHPDYVEVRELKPLRLTQTQDYLAIRLGDGAVAVPNDIQDVLRKPQMTAIYCDIVEDLRHVEGPADAWRPENEYELLDRFWDVLGPQGRNAHHPHDERRLRRLAGAVLDGDAYPWSIESLDAEGVDDPAIMRLVRLGWLRQTVDGTGFEAPHGRLLNFAAAQALVARCREGAADAMAVADAIGAREHRADRRRLGYLAMDWFHLALNDSHVRPMASAVLTVLQDDKHRYRFDFLYEKLLPTLGKRVVPLLAERLAAVARSGLWWQVPAVITGLATRPATELRELTRNLFADDRPLMRRAGLLLLTRRPSVEVLDAAWRLHREMQAEPLRFVDMPKDHTRVAAGQLYRSSFDALAAAVRLSPRWLVNAVQAAEADVDPVADLAYLAAGLDDGGAVWREIKAALFAKVPADKARSLALNIGNWRDEDEAWRLEEWAELEHGADPDLAAPAAVRALARIDPARAAGLLRHLPEPELYMSRGWFLPRLFLLAGDTARTVLHERIASAENPLHAILVYQGSENELDARTLDLLLDRLDERLARLQAEKLEASSDPLFRVFELLAQASRAELLEVFRKRRSSGLEVRIAWYLTEVVGPQRGPSRSGLSRDPALAVLLRMNGERYNGVLRRYLADADPWAKLDAIDHLKLFCDSTSASKLEEVGVSDELWESEQVPLLQYQAAQVLAGHDRSAELLRVLRVLGLKMPADIPQWVPEPFAPPRELLNEALDVVRQRHREGLVGSLMFLALAGDGRLVEQAVALLREAESDDLVTAALWALSLFADDSATRAEESKCISPYLQDPKQERLAIRVLAQQGEEGAAVLLKRLGEQWDISVALWLAGRDDTAQEAVDVIVGRLAEEQSRHPFLYFESGLDHLLRAEEQVLRRVLERAGPPLHERLREMATADEGPVRTAGQKRDAIRGLSLVDPDAGRLAADRALSDPAAKDRCLYPPLLYKIDPDAARKLFSQLAARDDENAAVIWTMAYVFDPEVEASWLQALLASPDAADRLGAVAWLPGPAASSPRCTRRSGGHWKTPPRR